MNTQQQQQQQQPQQPQQQPQQEEQEGGRKSSRKSSAKKTVKETPKKTARTHKCKDGVVRRLYKKADCFYVKMKNKLGKMGYRKVKA